ncbi:MAG: GGDEF domain-containing response regulator [Clostridia bacterium]|nr:GGDEF domain-containing response regulator [Clostridia bacterium]
MVKQVYVFDTTIKLLNDLREMFAEDKSFKFKCVESQRIDCVLKEIPDLIIINEDHLQDKLYDLCSKIRNDADNTITPIIVISSNEDINHKVEVIKQSVEYFVEKSLGKEYLYYIIKNIARLLTVNRTVSPLTGLPGNVKIQTELKKRISMNIPFTVLYLDLDNFKAYNDVYGFVRGDEIIKLTAQVITNNVYDVQDANVFVGHIGGDDFVAILDETVDYEDICQNIIMEFDSKVKSYFNEEDLQKGYFEIQNRKGIMEEFPLTSLSIGVVVAEKERFSNTLEVGEVGAQVKHLAKSTQGSCYAINRRIHE